MKTHYKEHNIIRVATEKANAPFSVKDFGHGKGLEFLPFLCENTRGHHLYILSDDEINNGDWVYDVYEKKIFKGEFKPLSGLLWENDNASVVSSCRKVIATTDETLDLPLITDYFTREYCNKGGVDKVLVEYEMMYKNVNFNWLNYIPEDQLFNAVKGKHFPKLNENKTIIIKFLNKEIWTREEVYDLIWKGIYQAKAYGVETIDDWINKNL